MDSQAFGPPITRPWLPNYPLVVDMVRVSGSAVVGVTGPIFPAFIQQSTGVGTYRDRAACYIGDPNGAVLTQTTYVGRLVNSYNNKPLYAAVLGGSVAYINVTSATADANGYYPGTADTYANGIWTTGPVAAVKNLSNKVLAVGFRYESFAAGLDGTTPAYLTSGFGPVYLLGDVPLIAPQGGAGGLLWNVDASNGITLLPDKQTFQFPTDGLYSITVNLTFEQASDGLAHAYTLFIGNAYPVNTLYRPSAILSGLFSINGALVGKRTALDKFVVILTDEVGHTPQLVGFPFINIVQIA